MMVRAYVRGFIDVIMEKFGYRRVAQCPECFQWFPVDGPGNWFQHLFADLDLNGANR